MQDPCGPEGGERSQRGLSLGSCLRCLSYLGFRAPSNPSNRIKLWKVRTGFGVAAHRKGVSLRVFRSVVARFSGGGMVIQPRER